MDQNPVWTQHLQPGEQIVWSASFSASLRKAARGRIRRSTAIFAVISGLLSVLAGYRLYEAVFDSENQHDLAAAIAIPLFATFGLALAIFSFFMFRKLKVAPPDADHYALTDRRLLAAGRDGVLVDEMPGADIAGVAFDNDHRPSELHVLRRGEDESMFFMEHLTGLPAVKARIEQQFPAPPEPAPPEPAPETP